MNKIYHEVNCCRVCKSDLHTIIALGNQKLTGIFPEPGQEELQAPVTLAKCKNPECGLVQLKESVDPNLMYGMDYGYRTGLNKSMYNHITKVYDDSKKWVNLKEGNVFLDIGSNDGSLVNYVYDNTHGVKCVGMDPTIKKFSQYYKDGTCPVPDFFSIENYYETCGKLKANLITSFSMFYDLEDPVKFANHIRLALDRDGVWIFEQAYLGFMLNRVTIDTVLSEHLMYYDLQSIDFILKQVDLKIVDVELNDVNAGSIRVVATHRDSNLAESDSVRLIKNYEKVMGFNDPDFAIYNNFRFLCQNSKSNFVNFLIRASNREKIVAALGASTKFNCLLQWAGISKNLLSCIGEVNPDKFGKVTPGTHIPIVPEDEVLESKPDYIVIGCYHFKDFFLKLPKIKQYILQGGTVVFPLPYLEFKDKNNTDLL